MCFAFLLYYPAENFTNNYCGQWRDVDFCDIYSKCDFGAVLNSSHPAISAMIDKVLDSCDAAGTCRPECPAAVEAALAENSCVRHLWDYLYDTIIIGFNDPRYLKFGAAMRSCDGVDTAVTPRPAPTPTSRPTKTDGLMKPMSEQSNMLLNSIKQLDSRPLLQNIVMNVNYNNILNSDDDDHAKTWH